MNDLVLDELLTKISPNGIFKADWIIVLANSVGAALSGTVLFCKLRDMHAPS
jgi:hypothetical protein